jgi:hypothetical protein
VPASDPTPHRILKLFEGPPALWSAGAISDALDRPPGGPLGHTPDPDIEAELKELIDAGRLVRVPLCPGCNEPGELFGLPAPELEDVGDGEGALDELNDAIGPLIEEGAVEFSEHVEVVERSCCRRTARLWREPPVPI